jgi:2-oxoglutarate dehydrogenase E2 component (dihydrolipoamide succinyltransferase)
MLSRRILVASRSLRVLRASQSHLRSQFPFPAIQQFRSYADKIVKVPDMAESISEGTLKQFSKQVGEFVEQDEEIATIETDKVSFVTPQLPPGVALSNRLQIDVAVNAPAAGTIKEFFANEEDTVTVGQDLLRLELGDAPEGGEKPKAESETKEPVRTLGRIYPYRAYHT